MREREWDAFWWASSWSTFFSLSFPILFPFFSYHSSSYHSYVMLSGLCPATTYGGAPGRGGAAAPNVAVRRVRPRGCAKLHERGPDAPLNRPRTPAEAAAIAEATSAAVANAIASAVDGAVSTAYANAAAAVPPAAAAAAVPEE